MRQFTDENSRKAQVKEALKIYRQTLAKIDSQICYSTKLFILQKYRKN